MSTLTESDTAIPSSQPGRTHQARILDGRAVAAEVRRECADEVAALVAQQAILPGLAVVRVGGDPASGKYAGNIRRTFIEAGLAVTLVELPNTVSRAVLQAELGRLSVLPEIAGVLVLMPLPGHLGLEAVIDVLDPSKDIEGITPINVGRLSLGLDCYVPSTPAGGIALLDYYKIPIEGKRAVIVGRSDVVGKPLAQLLLARNATVTITHSLTPNLAGLVAEADIVAAAVGKPGLITGEMFKSGATVLDFGAAMVDGKMRGDVDFEGALTRACAVTPVPGGTGPMTNAMLLKNTIGAIRKYFGAIG